MQAFLLPVGLLAGLLSGLLAAAQPPLAAASGPQVARAAAPRLQPQDAAVPSQDAQALAAYRRLLERHAAAPALDVVASVEQRLEPSGGGAPQGFLVEGEAHLARPASGWLRTSTVRRDPEPAAGDPAPSAVDDGADPPAVELFELVGDGEAIYEVDRATRTTVRLGDGWFALFPDVSPLVAWTGRSLGEPLRVESLEDPTGAGRRGLRITRAGAVGATATEVLWLDASGTLLAAETRRSLARGVETARFTFRSWELPAEVDPAAYARTPPAGFDGRDAFDQVEEALLPLGSRVPALSLSSLTEDGADLPLADLQGSATVLVFWFVDCAGCDEDLPRLQELWAELSATRDDLRFVGVGLGDDAAATRSWWESQGLRFPTYGQEGDAVSRAFGVRLYPSTFVLSKDGRVLWRAAGFDPIAVRAILAATR